MTAEWPYRKVDGKGGWLEVREAREGDPADPGCVVTTGPGGFTVDPLEIDQITGAMHVAHGHAPPVMLSRPDVDLAEGVYIGPLRAWLTNDGEVGVAVGASQSCAKPHQMRQFAAAAVVLADAADAPRPDPAEVEKLARVIHAGTHERGCGHNPTTEQYAAARIALAWMANRRAL